MIVLEFKSYGKAAQFSAIDEAIRTAQFIHNKSIRFWIDNKGTGQAALQGLCAVLAKDFPFKSVKHHVDGIESQLPQQFLDIAIAQDCDILPRQPSHPNNVIDEFCNLL
jgi:EAL domain-containing protein (putative c-di-GMP-specific phosphodiesterase class I)